MPWENFYPFHSTGNGRYQRCGINIPQNFHPLAGQPLENLERDRAHEWSGWMISNRTDSCHRLYLEHNLQAASKVWYAKIFIPCDHIIFHDDLRTFRQQLRQLHVVQVATAKSTNRTFANWTRNSPNSCAPMVCPHDILDEWTCMRVGMYRTSWRQIMVPEMPGTTLEVSKLHCQTFRQPLPSGSRPNPFLRKINLAKGCIRPNESRSNMTWTFVWFSRFTYVQRNKISNTATASLFFHRRSFWAWAANSWNTVPSHKFLWKHAASKSAF